MSPKNCHNLVVNPSFGCCGRTTAITSSHYNPHPHMLPIPSLTTHKTNYNPSNPPSPHTPPHDNPILVTRQTFPKNAARSPATATASHDLPTPATIRSSWQTTQLAVLLDALVDPVQTALISRSPGTVGWVIRLHPSRGFHVACRCHAVDILYSYFSGAATRCEQSSLDCSARWLCLSCPRFVSSSSVPFCRIDSSIFLLQPFSF